METGFIEVDNLQSFLKYAWPWPAAKMKLGLETQQARSPHGKKKNRRDIFDAVSKIRRAHDV